MKRALATTLLTLVALTACTDAPTASRSGSSPEVSGFAQRDNAGVAIAPAEVLSTVLWNREAIALFRARGGNAGRINAYVSLAQYQAVLAADQAQRGTTRPSLAGASAGAAAVVLSQFYPLDSASIEALLAGQRAKSQLVVERSRDFAAGEAIGRATAAAVLGLAASDNFGLTAPGNQPVGAGFWIGNGSPPVRGGLGARPFFLQFGSEVRSPPPPSFGSSKYLNALAEVRALSDSRTPEQVALTLKWVPFSGVVFNEIASDLIVRYRKSEFEAARILAYANAAAFDAIIGCFDTKYTYWFIRPTEADPLITLATGLPNHPSYPSAHSCESGAFQGVLADAFPSERASLAAIAAEASFSRVVGGLHYRFDGDAGLELGRKTARLALLRRGLE